MGMQPLKHTMTGGQAVQVMDDYVIAAAEVQWPSSCHWSGAQIPGFCKDAHSSCTASASSTRALLFMFTVPPLHPCAVWVCLSVRLLKVSAVCLPAKSSALLAAAAHARCAAATLLMRCRLEFKFPVLLNDPGSKGFSRACAQHEAAR